jgi:hypothetical protein
LLLILIHALDKQPFQEVISAPVGISENRQAGHYLDVETRHAASPVVLTRLRKALWLEWIPWQWTRTGNRHMGWHSSR